MEFNRLLSQAISFYGEDEASVRDSKAKEIKISKIDTGLYKSILNEKDLDKNVNETLDRIREVNVEKGRTMRSILADIWNMNEGKSPFDKVKKEEDEEVEKSSKTATGQKPTKVEIEPEVK